MSARSLKRIASFSSSSEEEEQRRLATADIEIDIDPIADMAPSAVEVAARPVEVQLVHQSREVGGILTEGQDGKERSVLVVGAGPAGLMLASNLARFGIDVQIVDDRADKTSTGRADGLQPKTIETFKQLRLADTLLKKGVKVYDICFWSQTATQPMHRSGREVHYPAQVDTLDPYILLVHQGMIEDVFLEDLRTRGVEVTRSSPFLRCASGLKGPVETVCQDTANGGEKTIRSRFVVGCDGAHSMVRKSMPGVQMVGESGKAAWGVLDGVVETDFPDIWSKVAIHNEGAGSILCIPRERNMTRLYIELHPGTTQPIASEVANQEFVMRRAKEIMAPFSVEWKSIEWFSVYRVGQRVASSFATANLSTFITGDASHTHSPKAAQGMNVSMHDSFNLGWKLNLAVRNLALPSLLATYEHERRLIAQQLIDFDYEHANAFLAGDAEALAKNFDENIRFISGIGAEYNENVLNAAPFGAVSASSLLKSGALLPPATVQRYIDANPVDLQLDIPLLGQFRVYFFVSSVRASLPFLSEICTHLASTSSVLGRATQAAAVSYDEMKVCETESDEYLQPGRYTATSRVFTPALITAEPKADVEMKDLPPLLGASKWTFYTDDEGACSRKYLGADLKESEVAVVGVRPDGYVGCVGRFEVGQEETARGWLDGYFGGFLKG